MIPDASIENMEHRLNEYLTKGDGKFCMENITWKNGYVTIGMFRKYLKSNVQKGILSTEKDEIGRIWYSKKQ